MLTHTGRNVFLLLVLEAFFLQICENLLLRICEKFTTLTLFVRTMISLLVRIAFLSKFTAGIYLSQSLLMLVGSQNCPQCRAEDGWGEDATLGPQTNELIN